MPAKDTYHDALCRALIKDGWTITDDPFRLVWGKRGTGRTVADRQALDPGHGFRRSERGDSQMDPVTAFREAVERVLTVYTQIPYAHGELRCEALFDRERDRYALVTLGWNAGKRVHFSLVHIDIVDGKIWIEKDNTEDGVASELVQAGIPKSRIVLAFRSPEMRKDTEYAYA